MGTFPLTMERFPGKGPPESFHGLASESLPESQVPGENAEKGSWNAFPEKVMSSMSQ